MSAAGRRLRLAGLRAHFSGRATANAGSTCALDTMGKRIAGCERLSGEPAWALSDGGRTVWAGANLRAVGAACVG